MFKRNITAIESCFHFIYKSYSRLFSGRLGSRPDMGVPDMTLISDIDEIGINHNLKVRYQRDQIYVSFLNRNNNKKIGPIFLDRHQYILFSSSIYNILTNIL